MYTLSSKKLIKIIERKINQELEKVKIHTNKLIKSKKYSPIQKTKLLKQQIDILHFEINLKQSDN